MNSAIFPLTLSFSYDELLEAVHAHIALLNHNLAPDPYDVSEQFAWVDERDAALLRFTFDCSLRSIVSRLAAWGACLTRTHTGADITLTPDRDIGRFETLFRGWMSEIILQSMIADKFACPVPSLRVSAAAVREECRRRVESVFEDMVSTLAILQPDAACAYQ